MNKEEAISQAQDFVRGKYPIVPPITGVVHVTKRPRGLEQQLFIESWLYSPNPARIKSSSSTWADHTDSETASFLNKWLIYFYMSWDTDAAGMPQTLGVMVDDFGSEVTQM
jgi:hypothetical protein